MVKILEGNLKKDYTLRFGRRKTKGGKISGVPVDRMWRHPLKTGTC